MPRSRFLGGETLDLPADLTDDDRDYLKQAFWDQRWTRWDDTLGPFVRWAIFVPVGFFVVLWLARWSKIRLAGKTPEPERPRLPYSPAMERLRNITLAVSACEILLWLVIAVLNDREGPQALADVVSIMFVAMLPTQLGLCHECFAPRPVHRGRSCRTGALDAVAAANSPNFSAIVTA